MHSPEYRLLEQTCAEIKALVVQMTKAVSQNQCDSVPLVAELHAGREMQKSLMDSLQTGIHTLLNANCDDDGDGPAWYTEVQQTETFAQTTSLAIEAGHTELGGFLSSHTCLGQGLHQILNKLEHYVSDVLGQAAGFVQSTEAAPRQTWRILVKS